MRTTTLWIRRLFAIFLCLGFLFAWSGPGAHAATIVVNTTSDLVAIGGDCTLREAMESARTNTSVDACISGGTIDVITFAINTDTDLGCSAGVCTIQPATALPYLTGSGNITINGYSQGDAAVATGGTPAKIRIVIDGSLITVGTSIGIGIQSPNNIIAGLAINQFESGIVLSGSEATDNSIQGCYVGTDAAGTSGFGNSYGIWVSSAGTGNVIGGTSEANRNLISGNQYGVYIAGTSTGTTVSGNYIGTSANGLASIPNENGIYINGDANNNTIGGSASGAGNLISGNTYDGITIVGTPTDPHDNTIEDNWIGVDVTGSAALANTQNGIQILHGAYSNTIGPDNIISGNTQNGILIWTAGTDGNGVKGNFIGTDLTGTVAIPNGNLTGGIFIQGAAQGTVIGGDTPAERNLISGNTGRGIRISGAGTDYTVVSGNIIGLDINGTSTLLNGWEGVHVTNSAANTTIGGTTSGEGNVIVADYGAVKLDVGAHDNTVSANLLGTDITGMVGMGGGGVAIWSGAYDNTIGGPTFPERNVISGTGDSSGGVGVRINGVDTDDNQVLRNYIGVDITGSGPLPNGPGSSTGSGVRIEAGAQSNIIGPFNIIAHHPGDGIYILDAATDFNIITKNSIYANANWNIALPNPNPPGGSNEGIIAPVTVSVSLSPLSVSGTTAPICASCTIEVFTSLVSYPPAGRKYLGTGTTDLSGSWTVSTPGLHGPYISATLTDSTKGTSMFSNRIFTTIEALYLPLIMR